MTGLTTHPGLQFLAIFAIGLVPYLESHGEAFVGTVTGVPVVLAALVASDGNLLALVVAARAGGAVAAASRSAAPPTLPEAPRRSW